MNLMNDERVLENRKRVRKKVEAMTKSELVEEHMKLFDRHIDTLDKLIFVAERNLEKTMLLEKVEADEDKS